MLCNPLRKLYQLTQAHQLQVAFVDIVRAKCGDCGEMEVCPAATSREFESYESVATDTINLSVNVQTAVQ